MSTGSSPKKYPMPLAGGIIVTTSCAQVFGIMTAVKGAATSHSCLFAGLGAGISGTATALGVTFCVTDVFIAKDRGYIKPVLDKTVGIATSIIDTFHCRTSDDSLPLLNEKQEMSRE